MISDEPDEDATDLDDDMILENSMRDPSSNGSGGGSQGAPAMPDWPRVLVREVGLDLDDDTMIWFKSTYFDWRAQMRFVLRAWVVANRTERVVQSLGLAAPIIVDDRLSN